MAVCFQKTSVSCQKMSVSPLVTVLVVLFGTGSWVAINGLWVELPLLVKLGIPEGYKLASYLSIIFQIANIGPILFVALSYSTPKHLRLEVPTIYIVLAIGIASCILLIFCWDIRTYWNVVDDYRSTALLILAFCLALVDCTSSVAFTPFMSRFKNLYITWYFVGEGFSSLFPSLVALGQGIGGDTECVANFTYIRYTNGTQENCTDWIIETKSERFPPEDFFIFLSVMMVGCGVAFFLLNYLPQVENEKIPETLDRPLVSSDWNDQKESFDLTQNSHVKCDGTYLNDVISEDPEHWRLKDFIYLFIILGWANCLSNGVLPSIQSYSCGAYGLRTYLLAATLANIANPVTCFFVFLRPQNSRNLVTATAIIGSLMGIFCITTAVLSPSPPLQFALSGRIIIVSCWVFASVFFTYTKTTIGWILRNANGNRSLLIWFGAITQIGSFLGALIMFPIINSYQVFEGYFADPCINKTKCIST